MKNINNLTPNITSKLGKNLHLNKNHPLGIIKNIIYDFFGDDFKKFDNLSPYVNLENNFDKLLIPSKHVSRSSTDTYYKDEKTVLRTHTSAHQNDLLEKGYKKFLITGDVYRKDTIDSSHYPIFHQMEGVKICENGIDVKEDLKITIKKLIELLFPNCEYIIREDGFYFTNPSWEVDVLYNGEWLEVLGCGVIHEQIMKNCGLGNKKGWAFGLGLERLAMILFKIPDIRYFWTKDERFHNQFKSGEIVEFKEYSKFPPCFKDISFWISDNFSENEFYEIIRNIGKDLVESVTMIDEFTNPQGKTSKCYRIAYRSNERNLTNEEINKIQSNVIKVVTDKLNIEVRK